MSSSKSAIQIFGRVRPPLKNSKIKRSEGRYWITENTEGPSEIAFHIPKDEQQGLINHKKETFEFKFNKVFGPDVQQEEVFDLVAKPVVESSMMGYNGTIFAYGQTGSGKTFTITGGAERYADRGLIPRTLQYIFKQIQQDTHTNYTINISYLEIYNEVGYDLLDSSRDAKKLEDLPKVSLMEDGDELIHLKNLSMVPAASEEDALNYLFVGDTNRMIAETPSNPASSRSHCIFIITITSRKDGEDIIRRSKLHLVDLAGSERVARTKVEGSLLKEAQHINLSLHYLEQVIIALHELGKGKRTHVPYRNSMMTSVLRDSLGGNCMTTMIATLAIEDILIEVLRNINKESISTCRFAQRVALVSNDAKLNEELDPQLMITRLKQEIARLKAELAIARGEQEGYPDGLPEYEKERVKIAVSNYVKDSSANAELVFSDFSKIQHAFWILKDWIINGSGGSASLDGAVSNRRLEPIGGRAGDGEADEKLRQLIVHRDNEINILVSMIAKLKEQIGGQKSEKLATNEAKFEKPSSLSTNKHTVDNTVVLKSDSNVNVPRTIIKAEESPPQPNLKATKARLSSDKAKAFEIFKQSYPASSWIDSQKYTLKQKYSEAKGLGEVAQGLRLKMKEIKESLSDPNSNGESLRSQLPDMIRKYKASYQQLKDLKVEIEHLQHLLDQGRLRMTRDFEAWFVDVYMASEQESEEEDVQTVGELLKDRETKIEAKEAWKSPAKSPLNHPLFQIGDSGNVEAMDRPLLPMEAFGGLTKSWNDKRLDSAPITKAETPLFKPRPQTALSNIPKPSSSPNNSAIDDIRAFYKARQDILNQNIQ